MIAPASDEGIVLHALSFALATSGLSFVSADHVAQHTAGFMPPKGAGGRMPPMGTARTRRALRALEEDGMLAVEVRRGKWAVHEHGRRVLEDWRGRDR